MVSKCWYVRVRYVTLHKPSQTLTTEKFGSFEQANAAHAKAQLFVQDMNIKTQRTTTYYVEPLFHAL